MVLWCNCWVRLKKEHVQKIAELVLKNLKAPNIIKMRVPETKVLDRIIKAINDDLYAEVRLEDEARKMLDTYRAQINAGQLDERKALLMIKKQLAKDKKMVL